MRCALRLCNQHRQRKKGNDQADRGDNDSNDNNDDDDKLTVVIEFLYESCSAVRTIPLDGVAM